MVVERWWRVIMYLVINFVCNSLEIFKTVHIVWNPENIF